MALKVVVKDIKEVAESLRDQYKQIGDEYVLDTDDSDYKQRLSEFRNNNIDLSQKLSEKEQMLKNMGDLEMTLKNYEGLDPVEAREALEKMRSINEKKLVDAGKLDEVLEQRTQRMRSDFEGQIQALNRSLDEQKQTGGVYKEKLTKVVIDNSLQNAVGQVATVRKGAMQDILSRGRSVWSLNEDGTPVPTGSDGKVMYGKDGKSMLSMEEWAQSLVDEASYLFEASKGGAAGGGMQKQLSGEHRIVSMHDQDSLNDNIEDIAAGKVQVSD
jgi:hypothetical protein